jgi:hypothetical protein
MSFQRFLAKPPFGFGQKSPYAPFLRIVTSLLLVLFCVLNGVYAEEPQKSPLLSGSEATSNRDEPVNDVEPAADEPGQTFEESESSQDVYGVVQRVRPIETRIINGQEERFQRATVLLDEALTGKPWPQKTVNVETVHNENPGYTIQLFPGTRVLLGKHSPLHRAGMPPQPASFTLINVDRTPGLEVLATLTLLAFLVIGGARLARQAVLGGLFAMTVGNFVIPFLKDGNQSATLFCLSLMGLLFPLILAFVDTPDTEAEHPGLAHWRRRVCLLGVWAGSAVLGLVLGFMMGAAQLHGYSSEALIELWNSYPRLNTGGLYFSSVFLAFQGFLYGLCRHCLKAATPLLFPVQQPEEAATDETPFGFRQRFALILQEGRPYLGSTLLGLLLLSLGLGLPTAIQFQSISLAQWVNQESTVCALTFWLSGCLALIVALPVLSALVAVWPPPYFVRKQFLSKSIMKLNESFDE